MSITFECSLTEDILLLGGGEGQRLDCPDSCRLTFLLSGVAPVVVEVCACMLNCWVSIAVLNILSVVQLTMFNGIR